MRRAGERAGDHVLGGVVEEGSSGVVLDSASRPRLLEELVRRTAEENALAAIHDRGDCLSHFRVVAVVERPCRGVDHPIEAHELVYTDCSHNRQFSWVRTPLRRVRGGSARVITWIGG